MDKLSLLHTATRLIRDSGSRVRVSHVDGSSSSTYGVVARPSIRLVDSSSITDNSLICWLQGTMKRPPGPGDIIKVGAKDYIIESVTRIQPDGSLTYAYAATVRA